VGSILWLHIDNEVIGGQLGLEVQLSVEKQTFQARRLANNLEVAASNPCGIESCEKAAIYVVVVGTE
jgi:hypothetical protein